MTLSFIFHWNRKLQWSHVCTPQWLAFLIQLDVCKPAGFKSNKDRISAHRQATAIFQKLPVIRFRLLLILVWHQFTLSGISVPLSTPTYLIAIRFLLSVMPASVTFVNSVAYGLTLIWKVHLPQLRPLFIANWIIATLFILICPRLNYVVSNSSKMLLFVW